MMQQINLYQPIFRKEQKIFSARTLLIGNLLVLLGLFALYGATFWQGQSLQRQLDQTIEQRNDSRNHLVEMQKAYPEKKRDPQLAERIKSIKARINFLTGISTTLASKGSGSEEGFSKYLAGLSRQDISQLWLNQITILNGGNEIKLYGLTTQSAHVPHYIQRLSHEPVFKGTAFHRLSIIRQSIKEGDKKKKSELIQFSLESTVKAEATALSSISQGQQSPTNRFNILDEGMR